MTTPRRRPITAEAIALRDIDLEMDRMVEHLVAAEGPAVDAEPVSEAKQLRDWGQTDPKVADPEGLKQQLMATGLKPYPNLLDPKSPDALAIVKAHPDIAPMYAEPCDDALADMLSRLAEYPLRVSILEPYADDPETMVRVSDSLDTRWQREMTQAGGETVTPDTAPAPVQMMQPRPLPEQAPQMNGGPTP